MYANMHMKSNAQINSNVIKKNHDQLMLQVNDTLRSLHDTCSQSAMTSARIRDYQNESMSQLSIQYVDNDDDSHQEECKSHMFDDLDSSDCESARSMPNQGSYTPKYDSARVAAVIERSNQAMAGCELTIERVNNTQRRLSDLSAECKHVRNYSNNLGTAATYVQDTIVENIQDAAEEYERVKQSRSDRKNKYMLPLWK